jgi:hypothetical protein
MSLGSWIRRWIITKFIPPIRADNAAGAGFFVYASHKSAVLDGRASSPLTDPLIAAHAPRRYVHITIGELAIPEVVQSLQVPHRLNWLEFLASCFCGSPTDKVDRQFLNMLLTPLLCRPKRFHALYRFRSFLVARYFALKFRDIATACDSAYVVCFYSGAMLGVVRAFRELGKPVWDIQHGHLGPTHDAYSNASAYRLGSLFQPTGFLVWNRSFGEYLEKTHGARWESTDYLHVRAFAPPRPSANESPTILFTLQSLVPLPPTVVDAVRRFPRLRWSFRLHPTQLKLPDELEFLRSFPNVQIAERAQTLPAALSACDLHVTLDSSVVHEAAALDKPSFILDGDYQVRFAYEMERGLARYVPQPELCEALQRFLEDSEARIAAGRMRASSV